MRERRRRKLHRPFQRMQKIEGRQKVSLRSTDFTVQSVVCSCSIGVQNQRLVNEYYMTS